MPNFNVPAIEFNYQVDQNITNALEAISPRGRANIIAKVSEFSRDTARSALVDALSAAMGSLSPQQFPTEFRGPLLATALTIPVLVDAGVDGAFISLDLDDMGNQEDLVRAFHRRAQLKEGGLLEDPYEGQELKDDNAEDRHRFFEAMIIGADYIPKTGKGKIKTVGLWEETVQEYLAIWGEKAPQWRFLQFGQTRWHPSVPPYAIYETVESTLQQEVPNYMESLISESLAISNWQGSFTPNLHIPVAPEGGLSFRGKTYRKGQFLPRS